ncbi:hypothetical protein CJ739_1452 [Mariniflexile rhizosphaerae]|uniref:DUF488 domain-containing protein n=1 Tax=unclassified Mariniflexile TaxID=2643887 RepID=UPI000CBE79DC|nr:DUF488 domain-containing protein [Mariniflexile sp. TRM1-10]AXP80541.1 hypothetical protein CJ739_1452 [Mariniflexile sp. TRM1-10]PLB20083.1 MAG: DUF488 domain containing protein [Flavobacteriaceae bacterium FS1-H7996/R]
MTDVIYSIGHGNKSIDSFINELKKYDIEYLLDVRTSPMSKFNPQFNRPLLEEDLKKHLITYMFAGEQLGGLPKDPSCYTNGKVDYSKIRQKPFFQDAIKVLIEANKENMKIALMCSESNPAECHRSKLIGQELLEHNISLNHIVSNKLKDQKTVIYELTKGKGLSNLFEEEGLTSRKTYI